MVGWTLFEWNGPRTDVSARREARGMWALAGELVPIRRGERGGSVMVEEEERDELDRRTDGQKSNTTRPPFHIRPYQSTHPVIKIVTMEAVAQSVRITASLSTALALTNITS